MRSGVREGLRDVARRLWPLDWTVRARLRPKPEEQPVMNHVSGLLGLVNVVDILRGFLRGSVRNLARMRFNLFGRDCISKESVRHLSQCEIPLINVLDSRSIYTSLGKHLTNASMDLRRG